MNTLRHALRAFFAARGRPVTGEQFIREYAALHATLRTKLDAPFDSAINFQDVVNLLGTMPLGRAITPAELRADGDPAHDHERAVLTDNAVSWIAQADETTASLVASLVARTVLQSNDDEQDAQSTGSRLRRVLATVPWNIDCAGLVRVGRLLAAMRQQREITARTLAEAALLVMCRVAWTAVHAEFTASAAEWTTMCAVYRVLRQQVAAVDRYGHARLLSVALFARDGLLPIPASGLIADVRLPGYALGFAWPGDGGGMGTDPLESAPLPLNDAALLTHVLLPGLRERGVGIPWRQPTIGGASLTEAVGRTPNDGRWRDVFTRVIERYAFARDIEAQGYVVDEVLAFACGAPANAPAARRVAPPAGKASGSATGADATTATAAPTHTGILASLRAQGVIGHDAALHELALLCDSRVTTERGPRVMISGPPGCGKTKVLTALAAAMGRPFVLVDASTLVENGWAGLQVADVAAMAFRAAGNDLARAEQAMICLDEIDKLRAVIPVAGAELGEQEAIGGDPRAAAVRIGRQEALLSLLDPGGLVTFIPKHGDPVMQLRTAKLIVVTAGVFRGLQVSGHRPSDDDLEIYGFIPEFIARLGARVVLQAPTVTDLEQLFQHGADTVAPAVARCRALGFELVVAPEAVHLVAAATAAGHEGLTPRSGSALLCTVLRRVLLDALHGERCGGRRLVVGPDEVLRELPSLREARLSDDG